MGLAESNGSLLLDLSLTSPAGCLFWKMDISTDPCGPYSFTFTLPLRKSTSSGSQN